MKKSNRKTSSTMGTGGVFSAVEQSTHERLNPILADLGNHLMEHQPKEKEIWEYTIEWFLSCQLSPESQVFLKQTERWAHIKEERARLEALLRRRNLVQQAYGDAAQEDDAAPAEGEGEAQEECGEDAAMGEEGPPAEGEGEGEEAPADGEDEPAEVGDGEAEEAAAEEGGEATAAAAAAEEDENLD